MQILGMQKLMGIGKLGVIVLSASLLLALNSCGGGKKEKVADEGDVSIDQLLGIESEKKPEEKKKQNPQEDEVLKLLGISSEGQKPAEGEATAAKAQPTPADVEQLRAEVQKLENELKEKEKLIQDLRNDLSEKEQRLEQLQSQPTTASRTPTLSSSAAASGSFRDRYRAALALYNAHKYREAIDAFSALLAEDPNNSLSDNCQYWIGECYYGLGNYSQAIAEFEKVFAYTNSNKADAALLKLGITYLRLGDRDSAKTQFQQLIATYPKSEYVAKAQSYLNRLQ
ncbi:MAG: tol-pal system protein YbgF [Calditrichaeota bacterium]|nr:MAG: tol-pal system protein YbgF [Calditrichota bacterium]